MKKLTLTEDHLKLIENLNIQPFDFSEFYSTDEIDEAIKEILKTPDATEKFAKVLDKLNFAKRRIAIYDDKSKCKGWGFDQWNLFGGTFVMEDIALIFGKYYDSIPGSETSSLGRIYPQELEDYWWSLYTYIHNNLTLIIKLVLQYSSCGGVTPGTYKYIKGKFEKCED